ncbi:MAG: GDP-mannose 4,6-dehydratase [Thermoplasmata archaeon]|nr:MAG: GDP-mannose 4,6-dehydratase [Thermoplasmata archaeon]
MAETRSALITGITGQDGSYLTELLLGKGYEVHGLIETKRPEALCLLEDCLDDVHQVFGNLSTKAGIHRIVREIAPDELYNLGAITNVTFAWKDPVKVFQINGMGVVRLLDGIRRYSPHTRLFQASTSELFGQVTESPQNEDTPFRPRNPYGSSKLMAHQAVEQFREHQDVHGSCAIMYNHESPRRGPFFVTRKITSGAASIGLGLTDTLSLGNLDARRDWGYAPDYVEAMWLMLQQDEPDDYVIATGRPHSVREMVQAAFTRAGVDDWEAHVRVDPRYYRPAEEVELVGDASKAERVLGWRPTVSFEEMVGRMVDADLEILRAQG